MSDPRKVLQAIAKQARRGSSAAPKVEDIYHPPGSPEREENLARFLSGSRMRDDAGDPLRLYHITKGDFSEFIPGGSTHPGDWESGPATWLSPYPDKQPAAHQVGGYRGDDGERVFRSGTNVMPVHAAIKNPLIIDDATSYDWARKVFADDSAEFPQLLSPQTRARLIEDGYDGIVYAGPSSTRSADAFYGSNAIGSHPEREEEIISLLPNTLKSATGNRGTFDPNDVDINKAEGGPVEMAGGGPLRKAAQKVRDALLGDLPEYRPGEETYLRFGKWPKNERSQNFITGDRERGVSVFGMKPSGLPESPDLIDTFPYRMSDHLSSTHADDPLHLVQGRPVGEGYDGEPLIQDITRLPTTWHRPQRWTLPAQKTLSTPSTDWSQFESFVKPYAGDYADGGPVNTPTEGEGGLYAAPNSTFDTPPPYDWGYRPGGAYAHGGPIEMAGGGADKIKEAVGFLRRLANYKDAPSKHIDDYKWKPMSEVGEQLGQIDAIPPHVENFGGFMQEQAQRAANEGLTPRDLLKAFGITRSSIQRTARPADAVRAGGLPLSSDITDMVRPEGAFATWMGTPAGQSWLNKGERGIVDFDAIEDAKQRLAMFGKNQTDLPQFLQWGPENLPGRESDLSQLVAAARMPGASTPGDWKAATSDIYGLGPAKRGFFAGMLGRGDQPVFDARQIGLHIPKGDYAPKFERRGRGEGGDEIMARLAARQEALGIGVPKDLLPFQQYLTHHTTWDKLGNEATTHQDLIDSLRGHAEGGPVEMGGGGAEKIKDAVGFVRRSIMPHAREKSMVPPNRDIESRYWDHKKPSDLDTITADYGVNHLPVDVPTMKIEDIKGGRVFAIPHDRSATDLLLGGYNGNTFANPVTSPGGPLYAFGRNPEAVTASGESVIKKLHESALRAADEGRTPYLAPWLMGPHGVDFSTHMNEAVVQSLPFLKVPSAKKDEVNAMLSTVFKDFPGIDHKDLAQYLHSMVGTTRRDLPKLLDTGAMVNAGLDVGGLRAALTEPSLLHAPYGSSGAAISRIDPSMTPTMFGYPHHPSYPWQLRGTPVGGLDPLVPSQILYPDFYRNLPPDTQLGPKGRPVNNRRAFEMSSMKGGVSQDVNDEVINGVNEYQEYMRKLRGWKEGGTVEDQYHPIWQQSFAGGGQPEEEPRGYFAPQYSAKQRAAIARQQNAERLAEITAEANANPGAYWRDLLTQIPRGAASIAELPGLVGDIMNLRADYLDSVAPGSSPTRIPHWGTSESISQGIDSLFPTPTTKHGAAAGRELGEMSLNALGLGIANNAGRVARSLGHVGNSANLASILGGGPGGDMEPTEQQPPSEPSYAYEQFMRDQDPTYKAFKAERPFYGMAQGGHAKDTGNTFDFLGPLDVGHGLENIADIAGGIFNGEDVNLHQIAGDAGQAIGTLLGVWAGVPGIGGSLGRGVGEIGADLIEPGEGGNIGQDAMRAGTGALRGGMGMFFANGGPVDFSPHDREDQDPNDPTRFLAPPVNPYEQPDPMDWAAANGVPGAVAPPLNRGSGQSARDAAERLRLMSMAEASSKQALQSQNKPKGGGGLMDMLGPLLQIGGMMSGMGGVTAGAPLDFGMGGAGQAAAAGMPGGWMPGFALGGQVPAPDGEQPWMYGDGALMARGGYLRGCGGMNG